MARATGDVAHPHASPFRGGRFLHPTLTPPRNVFLDRMTPAVLYIRRRVRSSAPPGGWLEISSRPLPTSHAVGYDLSPAWRATKQAGGVATVTAVVTVGSPSKVARGLNCFRGWRNTDRLDGHEESPRSKSSDRGYQLPSCLRQQGDLEPHHNQPSGMRLRSRVSVPVIQSAGENRTWSCPPSCFLYFSSSPFRRSRR